MMSNNAGNLYREREKCKQLIDTLAKNGGYILCPSASMDNAKPENVKAMFEYTRECGVY